MKTGFEGELILVFLDAPVDGKWFKTLHPFRYIAKDYKVYNVPAYTFTDFASIPRGFRWMISRVGKYGKAAVLHDYLCDLANAGKFKRKDADKIFLEAMKVLGVGWLKRNTMFLGVRSYSIFAG